MTEESREILQGIQNRLRACWNRLVTERIAVGLVILITLAAGGFAVLLTVEMRVWMPTIWRSILFWGWISATALLLIWLAVLPWFNGWRHQSRYRSIACTVAEGQTELQNQLVCLIELCNGKASPSPQPLLDHAVKSLDSQVSRLPLVERVNWHRPLLRGRFAAIPFSLLTILILAAPQGARDASVRLFSPGMTFERPVPFTFLISPKNTEVTKGDSLIIVAQASGTTLPEIVTFELGVPGERQLLSQSVRMDSMGYFSHQENNLRLPLRYRAVSGPVVSDWYYVKVIDRPVLRNLQITLHPPSYTKLPTEKLPTGIGNITALQGTRAHIQVRANIPGSRALLSLDSHSNPVMLEDMSGMITVHNENRYRVLLESPDRVRNLDPITYSVTPLFDQPPSIQLIAPPPLPHMDFYFLFPLKMRVQDDFGFSRLSLSWRLSQSMFGDTLNTFQELEIPLSPESEIQYLWDLDLTTGLDIVPGDVISYFVTIWDNDGYNGPKKSSSITQQLRLPSITERYENLATAQNETESGIESLLDDAEQIREQFEELRDELRRKQDSDWDDRQNLEALRQAQKNLQTQVDELANSMAEAAQQMEDHSLISDELLDVFQELQRVTEEISSPELTEALQELQDALSELDPAAMQESLEKFEFNEEMFRERMERTLELFKNFQIQQQLEEAARRAMELQKVQENLSQQTRQAEAVEDPAPLTDKQMLAAEEMRELEAKMEEIEERMQELQHALTPDMNALNEDTRSKEFPQNMQKNAHQMQSGEMQLAHQGQEQMSQSMQELQSDLKNVQNGMAGQQRRISLTALKLILHNVLRLSLDQENLRDGIAEITRESPLLRVYAREQSVLTTSASVVADSIQSLGRKVPQLSRDVQQFAGSVLFNMSTTTKALTDRNNNAAESSAAQAMTNLNNLALLLSKLLDQLQNASSSNSGSGMSMDQMIQQLQQMAGQQDQLNQALQEFFGREPGERLSPDMQKRLQQLAGQQEIMRQQLTEMTQERDLANRLAGDLERIAEQMQKSIQELHTGRTDRQTQQRQQQILTRLLDASRSLQERGKEKKREGRQGSDIVRPSPASIPENITVDELQRALMDALESGYAKDYQILIQRYFELLQNQ